MSKHVHWDLVSELDLLRISVCMLIDVLGCSLDVDGFLVESLLLRLRQFLFGLLVEILL